MKYHEFSKIAPWGNTTAFVYESPKSHYNYASGEVNEDTFQYVDSDTDFNIVGIDDLPEVKEVIIDNFLPEIAPAECVEDESFDAIKSAIENGDAQIALWTEGTETAYMLLLKF